MTVFGRVQQGRDAESVELEAPLSPRVVGCWHGVLPTGDRVWGGVYATSSEIFLMIFDIKMVGFMHSGGIIYRLDAY